MKEKTKKIILIVVMALSILGICLTVNHAKNNISKNDGNIVKREQMSGTPPDMQNGNHQNMGGLPSKDFEMTKNSQRKLTTVYVVVIASFSGLFSICLIYLLMSIKNKTFYKNKDKVIIYILGNIILITGFTIGTSLIANNFILNNKQNINESSEKDKVVLDKSNVVNEKK